MTVPLLRHSARALILSPDGELLLAKHAIPGGYVWAAPGGGIESGETASQALRRELLEEVGLGLGAHEPPVMWTQEIIDESICQGYDGVANTYFLVRHERFESHGNFTSEALVNEGIHDFTWWTLSAICDADSHTHFSPRNLKELVGSLLQRIEPDEHNS